MGEVYCKMVLRGRVWWGWKIKFWIGKMDIVDKDVFIEVMVIDWLEGVNGKWESRVSIGIFLEEFGIEKWGDIWRGVYILEIIFFFRWEIVELMRMI